MPCRKAMFERGVNTASGDRGNHASGVSHEQHARSGDGADKTSAGNHSCPHRNGTQPAKIVYRCNLVQEGRHHRILHRLVTSKATSKPYLNGVNSCDDPADVTRRQPPIDEAMQLVRLLERYPSVLVFHPKQELRVLSEAKSLGDTRGRPISADQIVCCSGGTKIETSLQTYCLAEGSPIGDARPSLFRSSGQPVHYARRIRGEKIVTRCRQIYI